jgi:uncharacterized membrane protein
MIQITKWRIDMNIPKKTAGLALALAAAGMMSATAVNAVPSSSVNVHCYGVNVCKGHNDCKTAENACKGQAACKGHGFVTMSEKACDDIGGTVGK